MTKVAPIASLGWEPHPAVWLLVGGLTAAGLYVSRSLVPHAPVEADPLPRRRRIAFWASVGVLWIASDWPVHDIAEEHLYFVHMIQHMLLTYVFPPLLLISIPEWLAKAMIGDGAVKRLLHRLARPIAAGLLFNAVVVVTHWVPVVDLSVRFGWFHYSIHLVMVLAALTMWLPVCGPVREWRLSAPAQMVYLFAMSIVPTVPGAWLTFAEGSVYPVYDRPTQLWGIDVTTDQQLAGAVMKILGGLYLWGVIAVIFARWSVTESRREREFVTRVPAAELTGDPTVDESDPLHLEALTFVSSLPAEGPGGDGRGEDGPRSEHHPSGR
ncbi:MAG: hypothetical protein KatS3mg008_1501 [Acidimicrobiales bacterium]|nr:MAG: hypothetical protein KatS3mg008_1501 [Acidimicrobiales bacterium]